MWMPLACPKDGGDMQPIPSVKDAWKCGLCGLEIWDGDLPVMEDYEGPDSRMALQSASYKPFVSRSFVGLPQGARSSGRSGRRKKRKKRGKSQDIYRTYV